LQASARAGRALLASAANGGARTAIARVGAEGDATAATRREPRRAGLRACSQRAHLVHRARDAAAAAIACIRRRVDTRAAAVSTSRAHEPTVAGGDGHGARVSQARVADGRIARGPAATASIAGRTPVARRAPVDRARDRDCVAQTAVWDGRRREIQLGPPPAGAHQDAEHQPTDDRSDASRGTRSRSNKSQAVSHGLSPSKYQVRRRCRVAVENLRPAAGSARPRRTPSIAMRLRRGPRAGRPRA
jgi:hypothetical protein